MKLKNTENAKKPSRISRKKLWIIIILIIVLALTAGLISWKFMAKKTDTKAEKVVSLVSRGDINKIIEGTGTVEAISQYEITSLAKGDVISDYFEEGEYVKKDQLLYQIDASSVDKNISKQKRNLEKAQMNYDDAVRNASNLSIKSSSHGVISEIYVSVGDMVQNGEKIADVTDKDTLVVTLPFGKFDAEKITTGNTAEITLLKSLSVLPGIVTRVATGSYVNSYGVEVTDVELNFANPGSVSENELVTAIIGDAACYDSGKVGYINTKTIISKASGEVKSLYKMKGDRIASNEVIAILESDSASKTTREAKISVDDANVSLEELYDNLEDYSIKSPISGKVIQKNIKAGEKMDSNSSSVMAIVADLSKLTFDMSIDELDISQISVGQPVSITADALPGRKFDGRISNISIVGTAYQGVTSYPVTVTIDNAENSELIPGMNVEASIIVQTAKNVLRVPVSAINMGNLVIVKDDGTFDDPAEMPMGFFNASADKKNPYASENNNQAENRTPGEKTDINPQNKMSGENNKASMPAPDKSMMPTEGKMPPSGKNIGSYPAQGKEYKQNTDKKEDKPTEKSSNSNESNGTSSKNDDSQEKMKQRMQSMMDNLDVPQGYTVVRVTTGLTDGSFMEIKEIPGSLKEGDSVILSAISAENTQRTGGWGGMSGMGGGMPPMGGGMPPMGGGMSGINGGMTGNRQSR